ncbi:MAG: branched-chain amino acid transport system II carrier protein [Flaviflexus sp.]|uniref:branched-chain amino acid transport system II carrier protein n=1 Tax=Flaviflexus sp. TaxID=1969482 RepID=UPI00352E282F
MRHQSKPVTIIITALALFSMYFGAGNLIFPVMIGMSGGVNVPLVITGFLMTGVALPVLGMIAASTQERGESDGIASRIGKVPGLVLTIAIFLSTGMLYAIPRVATVSYEIAVAPLVSGGGGTGESSYLFLYTLVFFAVVGLISLNPGQIINRLGTYLTPALLLVLAALIITTIIRMDPVSGEPTAHYANNPLQVGLLEGYYTMDAIASLVFSVIILKSLANAGFSSRKKLIGGATLASIIAGVGLCVIYLGLAAVGTRVAGNGFTDGAAGLAHAASVALGPLGQAVFGIVTILACLTTAIGLIGSSSQYFRRLLPGIGHPAMVLIQCLVALGIANLGLSTILEIVTPANQLLYPIAICIIVIAMLDIVLPGRLHWTYRLSAWIAGLLSIPEALWATKIGTFAFLREYLDMLPAGTVNMAWVVPALIGAGIGLLIDLRQGRLKKSNSPSTIPVYSTN